MPEYELM